jgi:hypothetical protein
MSQRMVRSMNKSEIAEKAARECIRTVDTRSACLSHDAWEAQVKTIAAIVERAIAESQAPERCNDCLWFACVPHQCGCKCHAELGDGEPSPPPDECVWCNQATASTKRCHRCDGVLCSISCEEWHLEKTNCESGAAQEVSPIDNNIKKES